MPVKRSSCVGLTSSTAGSAPITHPPLPPPPQPYHPVYISHLDIANLDFLPTHSQLHHKSYLLSRYLDHLLRSQNYNIDLFPVQLCLRIFARFDEQIHLLFLWLRRHQESHHQPSSNSSNRDIWPSLPPSPPNVCTIYNEEYALLAARFDTNPMLNLNDDTQHPTIPLRRLRAIMTKLHLKLLERWPRPETVRLHFDPPTEEESVRKWHWERVYPGLRRSIQYYCLASTEESSDEEERREVDKKRWISYESWQRAWGGGNMQQLARTGMGMGDVGIDIRQRRRTKSLCGAGSVDKCVSWDPELDFRERKGAVEEGLGSGQDLWTLVWLVLGILLGFPMEVVEHD